jgi:hypothetical protein
MSEKISVADLRGWCEASPGVRLAGDVLALIDAVEAIPGLMEIAEIAMPDSYFQSDSRVAAARAALDRFDLEGDD